MKREVDFQLLARINKVVLQYYAQAQPYKTEEDFKIWLKGLIPAVRFHFQEQGFEKHKNTLPFMRFALELNDIGMDEYLKKHLSTADYQAWTNPNQEIFVPDELNLLK
jgi:hypothetical protein